MKLEARKYLYDIQRSADLLTYFHGGRDMRLTDVHGRVVRELLA